MEKKELICIACPRGCALSVEVENSRLVSVTGEKCPRGKAYAKDETENPVRTVTSTIRAEGLDLDFVPVKTSRPVPKAKIFAIMDCVRRASLDRPVKPGDVIIKDAAASGADIVAARPAEKRNEQNSNPAFA